MSDSQLIMILITISGGLQDAYTYLMRDEVFANAQTGNIVLFTSHLFHAEWMNAAHYMIPVLSFALGIFIAEQIHGRFSSCRKIKWQQLILFVEIICLLISGFMPANAYTIANSLISFSCAMQVESFRTIRGCGYASTMCIGNLRGAVSCLSSWLRNKKEAELTKSMQYIRIIFFFAIGAGAGSVICTFLGLKTIWLSSLLLSAAFLLLFL